MNKILSLFGLILIKKKTLQNVINCIDEKVQYQKKGYGIDKNDVDDLESVIKKLKGELDYTKTILIGE